MLNIFKKKKQRELYGIPVLHIPKRYLSDDATDEDKEMLSVMIKQIRDFKAGNSVAIVVPSDSGIHLEILK